MCINLPTAQRYEQICAAFLLTSEIASLNIVIQNELGYMKYSKTLLLNYSKLYKLYNLFAMKTIHFITQTKPVVNLI